MLDVLMECVEVVIKMKDYSNSSCTINVEEVRY